MSLFYNIPLYNVVIQSKGVDKTVTPLVDDIVVNIKLVTHTQKEDILSL